MNNLHQLFEDVRNASNYEEMKKAGNAFYEDYRRALQGKYYAEKLEEGEYSSNTFPNPDYLHAWISASHALTVFSRAGHLTVEEKMKVSELGLNLERLRQKVEEGKIYIPAHVD